ncbi:MAG TPA: hypothetical protein VFS60_12895, partial [Thermoanaerobaculia bacterium]|nr:hypothetical protein [Thermoanaerobaculia bacterium]
WLRQGFGAEIPVDDDLGAGGPGTERAAVDVSFRINGEAVSKRVQVLGPGDVVGIHPRAIVKTEPRNFVTDFESNYLAYVEFYEEDFPWRFTPARAANELFESQLRPWIFLVVLQEDELEEQQAAGPLPAFAIKTGVDLDAVFPDLGQSWAWAHVHVSRNVIGGEPQAKDDAQVRAVEQNLEQALRLNRDSASSRLLCPRKLADNTAYHAFVVPAFEAGRRAGLGLDPAGISGQLASWGDGQRLYPIYYRWYFRTGAKGDFEFLVDLLEPRPVDKRVGVRAMDMQEPGYEVGGMSGPLAIVGLEGALKSPETESFPPQWPPAGTDFEDPATGSAGKFLNELEATVNLQFDLQQEGVENPHLDDPIVSPPLYGKWYALAEKLEAREGTGWVHELNRDPRYRTPAGAGTEVIQNEQEKFVQQAWAQLGDLLQANQKIRQLQLAWMSSFVTYRKNVLPQPPDQFLTFTHAVQARVLGSPTTIARQVRDSRLPQAALEPAFRKIARPRGAIMRKVVPEGSPRPRAVLQRLNAGTLSAAPPPPDPTGQISLDAVAGSIVPESLSERLRALLLGRRWIAALAVLAVALFLLGVVGGGLLAILLVLAAAGVGALGFAARRLRRVLQTADGFREASFRPAAVDEIPARPGFVLTEFDAPLPATPTAGSGDSVEARNFRIALKDAFNVYQSPPPAPPVPQPLDLGSAVATLRQSLDPAVAIPRRAEFVLKVPASIKSSYLRPQRTLVTVMAHPVFGEAMYRPLRDLSAEFLAPNLALIPNNTISLMETNQRFIEAYMVGLNDEMGRELLWRQFPTDQRGSYFRQFWDVADTVQRDPAKPPAQAAEELLDITRLHTWGRESALGDHASRPLPSGAEPGESRLVLVVRGDLLRKYPTAVIYAQRARWKDVPGGGAIRELDDGNPALFVKEPIFKAEIEPDLRFLGFDLTATVAKGSPDRAVNDPGWYFVIQERPGEPRFGLDNISVESSDPATSWNELAWEHLENFDSLGCIDFSAGIRVSNSRPDPDDKFEWGRNAADTAYILFQVPVMVAFHADDMLA